MSFGRELKDFSEGFQHGVELGTNQDKARLEAQTYKDRYGRAPDEGGPTSPGGGGARVPTVENAGSTSSTAVDFKDDPQAGQVLGFIRDHEAGTDDPYNTLVGGKKANLTGMTVGDVLNYQQSMIKNGHESTAIGAYQVINPTLKTAVAELKLDPKTPFNEATQDQIGYHLLQKRGWNDYKSGKIDKDTFMDNVANEWAILPLASGRSAYEGVGSNKAGMSRDTFASIVPDDFSAPTQTASTSGAVPEPDDATGFFGADTEQVDPKLRRVTERAARDNPGLFKLNPKTKTIRTEADQRDMVDKGWSKTMNSKHRVGKAADLVPINPTTGQADPDYTAGYDAITKAMRKAAQDEGVSDLKWGGDWKSFQDRPHWEVSQLEQQQLDAGGLSPPRDQQVQPALFAASGGVIPEPQYFADGGVPKPQPYVNTANPSAVNGVDKYSSTRAYTQPIASTSGGAGQPRRINFSASQTAPMAAGPTPSQIAFKQQRDAAAAAAAKAAADKAAADAAARAVKPAVKAQPRQQYGGQMVYAPGGGQGGQQQWFQLGDQRSMYPNRQPSNGNRMFAQGGVIPEPGQISFARGGTVPDRDKRFQELMRQESRPADVGDHGGGESARDRAARRLSAQEGRASSTAYRPSQDKEYFRPAGKPGKGGGKPDKIKTSSTKPVHVRHPPNPKVGVPEPVGPGGTPTAGYEGRPPTGAANQPSPPINTTLGGTPTAGYEGQPGTGAANRPTPGYDPRGTPNPVRPEPINTAAGTPLHGYEQPIITGPPDRPLPNPDRLMRHAPISSVPEGRPDAPIPPNSTPRQRYDEEIRRSIPTLPQPQQGPSQPDPELGPQQGPPISARPAPPDAARTAADEADTRKRMELVTTPPANAVTRAALPEPESDPNLDWKARDEAYKRKQMEDATTPPLVPVLYNPETGELIDVNAAQAQDDQRARYLGFARGGVIPEPGQPGYNEAVASGQTERAPVDATTTASLPPDGGEPQRANVRATPTLLSDVSKALHNGVQYLTQQFGLGGEGAVTTPEDGPRNDAGAQRFAGGEGAATREELAGIDKHVDPTGELDEGSRQMARLGKTMRWYQERGRKEEAGAAAGSLMQYGAQRFQRLGMLAAASYKDGNLETTVKYLEKAYEMIPDGAQVNVRVNKGTGKLEAERTDADGNTTFHEIDSQELPGLLRQVQDKSMYWNSVFRLADPEGAQNRDIEQRQQAAEQRATQGESVRHKRDTQEELDKEKRAGEAETAKNAREKQETIDTEARAATRKAAEDAAAVKQKQAETAAASKEHDRQALLAAGIDRAKEALKGDNTVLTKVNPMLAELSQANASGDQTQIDAALNKIWNALPDSKDKPDIFTKLTEKTPQEFTHTDPAAAAAPRQAKDGKWYRPDPARPGKFIETTAPVS